MGHKRNPMKGLYKLFLHTTFSYNMSTSTKDIQFPILVTVTLTLSQEAPNAIQQKVSIYSFYIILQAYSGEEF